MAHCFTLARDHPFEGIEGGTYRGGSSYLDLGIMPERTSLVLGDGTPESMPALRGTTLIQAKAVSDDRGNIFSLIRSSGGTGYLLRIKTYGLALPEKYAPLGDKFPLLKLFVGGEGAGVAQAQAGDRRGFEQDQLFALDEGKRIIVADKYRRVLVYFVRGGRFLVKAATETDVLAHVRARASLMKNSLEVKWGLKVCFALSACDERADPLVARMRELEQGFVLDWNDYA